MIRHLTLVTALGSALAMSGCGTNDQNGDNGAGLNQQEAAADNGVSQTTDAATQALFNQSAAGSTVTTNAVGMHAQRLDLTRLNGYTGTVLVSSLVDANGHPLYPHLSGSFGVTVSGSAISSWPTQSNANANFTVVVNFAQNGTTGVSYTDPASGAVATITSGTITFQMVGAYAFTSTNNWVLTAETATTVAQGAPLDWTVTRPNDTTRTVSLYGYRHVSWSFTRADNSPTVPAVDSLVVSKTIDGLGLAGGPSVGPFPDTAQPSWCFTNWVHTVDGGPGNGGFQTTWNRYATATLTWDFTQTPTKLTIGPVNEVIFFTRDGLLQQTNSLILGTSADD
jgi:hypothetical protein